MTAYIVNCSLSTIMLYLGKLSNQLYKLVMQQFQVVHHGICHKSLVFSRFSQEPLGECVHQEITSDKWDIP